MLSICFYCCIKHSFFFIIHLSMIRKRFIISFIYCIRFLLSVFFFFFFHHLVLFVPCSFFNVMLFVLHVASLNMANIYYIYPHCSLPLQPTRLMLQEIFVKSAKITSNKSIYNFLFVT